MDVAEVSSIFSAVGAVSIALISAIYLRGKKDGQMTIREKKIDQLDGGAESEAEFRGAQAVWNRFLDGLGAQVRKVEERALKTESGLDHHVRQCAENQQEIFRRFDRLDANIQDISRRIDNVAAGRAGKMYEVRTPPGSQT